MINTVKSLLMQKPLLAALVLLLGVALAVVAVNLYSIRYGGSPVAVPAIPRGVEQYGQGGPLTYVVMGDSTTIAQGGDYDQGYARQSARYLAVQGYAVRFVNVGVSGARAADIPARQIPRLRETAGPRPDVVLIAVGANDITHLTSTGTVARHLSDSIDRLRDLNPDVHVVLTGSPQMGSVPRFAQPVRWFAKVRTGQVNEAVKKLVASKNVTFAPIAEQTGPLFAAHPEYFAADKFHPNNSGYATWTPVVTSALNAALQKQ